MLLGGEGEVKVMESEMESADGDRLEGEEAYLDGLHFDLIEVCLVVG
jgi:hypothetical protein